MNKQVTKDTYRFELYCGMDRWSSYHYQLRDILAYEPKNVLEIGVGDGILKYYLSANTTVAYTSVDVAEDLNADVQGDVRALPFSNESFDTVCAFEVLEHLPFTDFEKALAEMCRVSKHHVLISIPHFGPPVKVLLKIPFLPELRFAFKIPFPREHVFNGQHYWELGKRKFPVRKIRTILKNYFIILREYIPFENQYHHFFVLEKKNSK